MFKKTHSNGEPRATVLSELGKEFRVHLAFCSSRFKKLVREYPEQSYALMVFLLVISMMISFTAANSDTKPIESDNIIAAIAPAGNGFDQIQQTGTALKQTLALRSEIELMAKKDSLSAADSIRLQAALEQLHQLNQSLIK